MIGNNDVLKPSIERINNPNHPDIQHLATISTELAASVKACDGTKLVNLAVDFSELSSQLRFFDHVDLIGYNYKEHLYA